MKMHGPDRDHVINDRPLLGCATTAELRNELRVRDDLGYWADDYKSSDAPLSPVTLSDIYDIIHDRLKYARVTINTNRGKETLYLSGVIDIDAVTQQCMVELRKKLGLYTNDNYTSLGLWTGGTTPA